MTDHITIQPATTDDFDFVVSVTRAMRVRLARWAPIYFRPAEQADELHAGYLGFILGSDDHETRLVMAGDQRVGFLVNVAQGEPTQGQHTWVDDLCIVDESKWPEVARVVTSSGDTPWLTCVSASDRVRSVALKTHGASLVSSYWARSTVGVVPATPGASGIGTHDPSRAPRHTFGGQAFRSDAPGALVIAAYDGDVIGSPSMMPPLYNPGGPTTIVDQIIGARRPELLHQALGASADRGDAQLVVVCGHDDTELEEVVGQAGFTRVVNVIGHGHR